MQTVPEKLEMKEVMVELHRSLPRALVGSCPAATGYSREPTYAG
jgi:hypothetical protein